MQSPSSKQCSRCHNDFICNPTNIAACQCSQVSFSEAEKAFIERQGYDDCLCLDCLKELKAMAAAEDIG